MPAKATISKKANLIPAIKTVSSLWYILILFLAAFVFYGNSMSNGYNLDDNLVTRENHPLTTQGINGIPEIFTSHFDSRGNMQFGFRPMVQTSFAIEYSLFGLNPKASHFINVLLYALTVIVIFSLFRKLLPDQPIMFPWLIAFLFLIHPIHTEPVNNLKSRDELLYFLFALLSAHAFLIFIASNQWKWFLLAIVLLYCAAFSKVTVVPFAVVIPLILWFFTKTGWKKIGLIGISSFLIFLSVWFYKNLFLEEGTRVFFFYENPLLIDSSVSTRLGTCFSTLAKYWQLMIFPHPLSFYYGYNEIQIREVSDPLAIIFLIVNISIFGIAVMLFRQKHIISFGILFFFIMIGSFSNLLMPVVGIVGERFAYGASLGFVVFLAWLLMQLTKNKKQIYSYRLVPLLLIIVFSGFKIISRNKDWKDSKTLYEQDITHLEQSAKAHTLLATLYSKESALAKNQQEKSKYFQLSISHYEKTIAIYPEYYQAINSIGSAYYSVGDNQHAERYFVQTLEIAPEYSEGNSNLGWVMFSTGRANEAKVYFEKAIELEQNQSKAYFGLAECLLIQNDTAGAALIIDQGLTTLDEFESNDMLYNAAINFYQRINKPERAEEIYNLMLSIKSGKQK